MTLIYWLAAVVAVALSIYLTVALLKPEWFE
jgi:K+-transporting ATPase KdpF subunit